MSVGWVGSWVMKMDPWTTLDSTPSQNGFAGRARSRQHIQDSALYKFMIDIDIDIDISK